MAVWRVVARGGWDWILAFARMTMWRVMGWSVTRFLVGAGLKPARPAWLADDVL